MEVSCVPQFQPSHNGSVVCSNGTWTVLPKCVPAKCRELPDAPRNGMVVAPNMDHGMVGKFEVSSFSVAAFCCFLMDFIALLLSAESFYIKTPILLASLYCSVGTATC